MVVRLTMMMRRGRWAIARRMVLSVLALATPVAAIGAPADATAAAPPGRITTLVTGARIAGANGMHFGPDGLLYVASVVGGELLAMNPDTGAVVKRWNSATGVDGPDDVAFAPDGSFYWTSILTGEVAGFRPDGTRVTAARLTPGVNPLTFADDGRLFVAQCFFGTNLYEVDPNGVKPARLIRDDLGPKCGLNGMDWGPDGRLYGPRWFRGEVVSIDVATGALRTEVTGVQVPASVKFDSKGRLHVLDTMTGQVLRIDGGAKTVVATLTPGLDNFAFDRQDELFVSSFADGFVVHVKKDGSTQELSPGGMVSASGLAVRRVGGRAEVIVADLYALRGFDPVTGAVTSTQRDVLGISPMGSALTVAADGTKLILSTWVDNAVRVWDPDARRVVQEFTQLKEPVDAVRFGSAVAISEFGGHRVIAINGDRTRVVAGDLPAPTGLVVRQGELFVTERSRGQLLRLTRRGMPLAKPVVIARGLTQPEGVALLGDGFVVVEAGAGRITQVDLTGRTKLLARVAPGNSPAGATQPPSFIFNGVAVLDDTTLFVTSEQDRSLQRIDLPARSDAKSAKSSKNANNSKNAKSAKSAKNANK